jgi:subtilisin-like proprotein convertase family protein
MRRRVTALGAAALVAGLALFVGVAAAQERVTAQATTVTKNYKNVTPIVIPDEGNTGPASPYPSTIQVSGLDGATIRDVNVKLRGYSHTFPDDVDVLLVGPARTGKDALIMSDAGGGRDLTGVSLTIDDEAPSPLPNRSRLAKPIVSASYKPSNYIGTMKSDGTVPTEPDIFPGVTYSGKVKLSAFNRARPNGTWRLYVVDDGHADTGQFAGGWSLQITARVR